MEITNPALMAQLKALMFPNGNLPEGNLLEEARSMAVAFPLILQSLIKQSGKRILVKPQQEVGGCTDGSTICVGPTPMPTNPQDLTSYLLYLAMKLGIGHHEVGHCNHSGYDHWKPEHPVQRRLYQIAEDVRQEGIHVGLHRTGRKWLDALAMAMVMTGLFAAPSDQDSPVRTLTGYLLYRCRCDFRNQTFLADYAAMQEARMEAVFPKGITLRLDALVNEVPRLRSSKDCVSWSAKVMALLQQELEDASAPPPSPQDTHDSADEANGQGDDGAGNDAGANDPSDSAGNSESPQGATDSPEPQNDGSPAPSDTPPTPGDAQGNGDAGHGSGSPSPEQEAAVKALQQVLQGDDADSAYGDLDEAVRQAMANLSQDMASRGADVMEADLDVLNTDIEVSAPMTDDSINLSRALGLVGALQCRLRGEMQTLSNTRSSLGVSGGRLDPKALTRAAMGDPRIFRRTHTSVTVDTAVLLLCDVSGSMASRERIQIASESLFATAVALQGCPGVSVAVAAFPYYQVVLPFGGRARREEKQFRLRAGGSTPMHEGVLLAMRMLATRREPRKLLMVLTDGDPDDQSAARACLLSAERAGIEVYGIGIQTPSVMHLFRRNAIVNDVSELPHQLLGMLRSRLTQAA